MLKWINHPRFVSAIPIIITPFFCWNAASQTVRMWMAHTARGQAVSGYWAVILALTLMVHFYRRAMPQERAARYCIMLEIALYLTTIASIWYWRA